MRRAKELLFNILVWASAIFTVGILIAIIGFIFIKGIGKINLDFLISNYDASNYNISISNSFKGSPKYV